MKTDVLDHMAAEDDLDDRLLGRGREQWIENSRMEREMIREDPGALEAGGTSFSVTWDHA